MDGPFLDFVSAAGEIGKRVDVGKATGTTAGTSRLGWLFSLCLSCLPIAYPLTTGRP
jgi:hypothetical protein